MLGSGIFVLPGIVYSLAGPWVAVSYLLAGLLVVPGLLSQAELATAMPVAGGVYVYVDRSMGPLPGTITGLGTWAAMVAKSAFALVGLGMYLAVFSDLPAIPVALAVLAVLLLFNVIGVGKASILQVLVVALCSAALVAYGTWGIVNLEPQRFQPAFPHGASGFLSGAAYVFVSYAGVAKVCSVAEEIRDPDRNITWGMIGALLLIMVLYALVAVAVVGTVDPAVLVDDVTPVATSARNLMGQPGAVFMSLVVMVGLISMCNAGILAAARYPFAMSRDALLPPFLMRVHRRFGTPVASIVGTGLVLVAFVTLLPVEKLAKLASAFTIFVFCVVNLAVVVFRESGARWYKPGFRTPLYPWMQIIGLAGGMWLLVKLGWVGMVGVGSAVVLGSGWYVLFCRPRVHRQSVLRHLWGESRSLRDTVEAELEEATEDPVPRVIVPLFGGEKDVERLVHLGAAFLDYGKLEVLRLEEVPDQSMLTPYVEADDLMRDIEDHTLKVAEELHVDVTFRDLVTHNAKQALVHHARATRAEWIVMGWPGRRELHYLVRHPMAWWLDHPPCDLAIYRDPQHGGARDEGAPGFFRILLLALPGPYDTLILHIADRLALQEKAELTLFLPVPVDEADVQFRAHEEYHRQLIRMCRAPARSIVQRTMNAEAALAEESTGHDLLVLGAPREAAFRNLLFGSPEMKLVENVRCPVLRLKAPRHHVHHRFRPPVTAPRLEQELEPFLLDAAVRPRLQVARQGDLWSKVAGHLAAHVDTELEVPLRQALDDRERSQSTAVGRGYALSGPFLAQVDSPLLGIFTLQRPVDFGMPEGKGVDVCLVVLASPADRKTQLWLLDLLSRLARETDLVARLREARNVRQVLQALRAAAATVTGRAGAAD